ncbi:RidA family protein [Nevskia ramosa]|uniref:RidA family protein n=1 Tax=Nevskia ramosa TaxID=64002 RepID=UPI0023548AF3|nr:RidA family protein [Nevskia ramosa]
MTNTSLSPRRRALSWLAAGALLSAGFAAQAHDEVTRTTIGDPKFPIAAAVTVPHGYSTTYLSGNLPDVANAQAPKGTVEAYGNTETQTASVLKKLGDTLKSLGLGYGDVVSATVYLVGDPAKGGEIDFAGMNAAFSTVFGAPAQPNKPARSTVKVAGLVLPGALVEIDLIAVHRHGGDKAKATPDAK